MKTNTKHTLLVFLLAGLLIISGTSVSGIVRPIAAHPEKRVFIGDSRTVGMYDAVYGQYHFDLSARRGNEVWSAWSGKGVKEMPFLVNRAREKAGGSLKGYKVYILLGVNNLREKDNPKEVALDYLYELHHIDWNGARVYFVSVNPVCENGIRRGPGTNKKIEEFNRYMKLGSGRHGAERFGAAAAKLGEKHLNSERTRRIFNRFQGYTYIDTASRVPEFKEVVRTGKYTQDPQEGHTCVYHKGYVQDGLHYIKPVYEKIYKILLEY